MLKLPMIETGLSKKAGAMLKRAAIKATEKQVENTIAFAAGFAAANSLTCLTTFDESGCFCR